MSNEMLFLLLILCIIVIAIGVYYMNKPKRDLEAFYNKRLADNNAKCALMCRYIKGLTDLIENISCYIFADEQKITIVPIDNEDVKISLQISKIKTFQHILSIGSGNLIISPQQGENNSIIIHYESENNEIKELVFSLTVNLNENRFNLYAASQCNIIDYVNARIPKQKTNINL